MDVNKSGSQFPLPGVAIILLALGVFVFSDNPFKPSRPDELTELTTTAEDVRARLWQDPFVAVELHRINKHSNENLSILIEENNNSSTDNTIYQDQHHRICSFEKENVLKVYGRYLKTMSERGDNNVKDKSKNILRSDEEMLEAFILSGAHTAKELNCQIQRDITHSSSMNSDLHILAVMVPGGPYPEDRETRIRSRYAVISGLSNAGYIPIDSQHIGYMDYASLCEKKLQGYRLQDDVCDMPATIPYEWFKPNETFGVNEITRRISKNVLVMWLDDNELSSKRPLYMLDRLSKELSRKSKVSTGKEPLRIKFDVLGPATSTTLVAMYKEAYELDCSNDDKSCDNSLVNSDNNKSRIISPRATLDNVAIKNILNLPADQNLDELFVLDRMISTDEVMVQDLICELVRRGVNPYKYTKEKHDNRGDEISKKGECSNYTLKGLNKKHKQDHIVLIGEWDTAYSRNYNRLFRQAIGNSDNNYKPDWLHSYNYLRGIDGSIGEKSGSKSFSGSSQANGKKQSLRRPVGENQYDYLRRLGDQLTSMAASIRDSGLIRAIGIVGSDTYDKLLVLQSLRSRFPDVVFFTTDLDARMLHKEENEWARNLVVASGYGLAPDHDAFMGLEFRDVYQTALYNSTTKATLCNSIDNLESAINTQECKYAITQDAVPKIFEIGNTTAIDYTRNKCVAGACEKNIVLSGEASVSNVIIYVVLSFVMVVLLLYQTSDNARKYIVSIALLLYFVLSWVFVIDTGNSIEFQYMLSGTSIWPAVIIRMVAAVLAIFMIIYAISSLRINTNSIISMIDSDEKMFIKSKGLVERVCVCIKGYSLTQNRLRVISKAAITELFRSAKSLLTQRYFRTAELQRHGYRSSLSKWAHYYISLWGWRYSKNDLVKIDELVFQYIDMGRTRCWTRRVFIMWFVYMASALLFMKSFSAMPYAPFSDPASYMAHDRVMKIAVAAYTFLIFLVVDVTRLNARFVELLTRCRIIWTQDEILKYQRRYGVSQYVAVEDLKLKMIVQRSKAVDVLIFLPFVVLTLMVLSRSDYFDRWNMPLQLAFIILFGAMIALSSAIRLRRTAKRAQTVALKKLRREYKKQIFIESSIKDVRQSGKKAATTETGTKKSNSDELYNQKMSERIQIIINDINNLSEGPFVPIAQHPIVAAIAMPFGGVGGLYLIEFMTSFGV